MTQAESGKMLNESKHHPLTRIKKDLEKNRDTQDAFLEIDSNLSFFIIRGKAFPLIIKKLRLLSISRNAS